MCGISYHFFEHKVFKQRHRQTRTAEIARHSSSPPRRGGGGGGGGGGGVGGGGGGGGRRSVASAFLFIAALEHAILHWSVRKQPQRIAFEIVFVTFCKTYKSPFYCRKYHQTKWRVHTPYPIITVQK